MESNTNNISSAWLHGSDQRQRRSETSEEVDLRRGQNALGSCRYLPFTQINGMELEVFRHVSAKNYNGVSADGLFRFFFFVFFYCCCI